MTTLWIIIHTHRGGVNVYPVIHPETIDECDAKRFLGDAWEEDNDEFIDIDGPYDLQEIPVFAYELANTECDDGNDFDAFEDVGGGNGPLLGM